MLRVNAVLIQEITLKEKECPLVFSVTPLNSDVMAGAKAAMLKNIDKVFYPVSEGV